MRYATLFTTYAWDDFVARQYQRVHSRMREGDLYIMADESHGTLGTLPTERVIRTNQTEILHHGGRTPYIEKGDWEVKAPLWWNLDFLTYRFFDDHQEYDYCVTMDFDACISVDMDELVKKVAEAGYDYVALPVPEAMHEWYWLKAHAPVYSPDEIAAHLLCVIIISRKASNYLAQRRRDMAAEYAAGTVKFWPFCEAFMSTELKRAGFRIGNLSDFGDAGKFGWWPVYNENDIVINMPDGFIHPVMNKPRFLSAYLQRYKPKFDWLRPHGPLWSQLRRFHFPDYASYLWPAIAVRLGRGIRRYVLKTLTNFGVV